MSSRPRIKIDESNSVILYHRIAFIFVLLQLILIIICFNALPDTIPSHYNFAGQADNFSNKNIIWFSPALSFGIYLLLKYLSRYPHRHNYRVKITKENALEEYTNSIEFGAYMNMLTCGLLCFVAITILITGFHSESRLGTLLLPITVLYLVLIIKKNYPTKKYKV